MRLFVRAALLFIMLLPALAMADPVRFTGGFQVIGKHIEIFEDKTGELTFEQIIHQNGFVKSEVETPNMGLSQSTFWIRFSVINDSGKPLQYLELGHPLIHSSSLYALNGKNITTESYLETDAFGDRAVKHQNLVFKLNIPPGNKTDYYLKVKAFNQVILPLIVRDQDNLFESTQLGETIGGIFVGIILVMVLYNLFIYFSILDRSYLFYVLYVLSVGLAQTSLTGYAYKYFWPGLPSFNSIATIWFSGFAGVFAMLFVKNFLQLPEKWPTGVKIINVIIVLYSSTGLLNLAGFELLSFRAVDVSGGVGAVGLYIIGIKLSKENNRPAKLFLLAWTIFLLGLFLIVLRNINILPYNIFTTYTMQLGSILEVVLLSIALADKINILKKEREESQANELRVLQENETIIREQNVSLELKVKERTIKLVKTNDELINTLDQLKETQTQLIESEKMASLGQLTAGIAHEINNPINFVSSNIKPLRRDIDDLMEILATYDKIGTAESITDMKEKIAEVDRLKQNLDLEYLKTELEMLLRGMEDGANRTVEIVKGLKIFSRLDDMDLNLVNINEGLESTIVILNYQLRSEIQLIKELGDIPSVEGYGGKLNQVFMNILTNSIYALYKKPDSPEGRFIWVKTYMKGDSHVVISLKDNGTGMDKETKAKIFDPFFTTKDVGEGTGLGLSIVFKIIEVHNGSIEVNSETGVGTQFLITLPVKKQKLPIPVSNE
jgi:signal transduction histidine kinase